jgi:4-hydroxybenzoate polyprenyltransferase
MLSPDCGTTPAKQPAPFNRLFACLLHTAHAVIIATMLKPLIKSMRPRQWAKNVFIFAPLVFDRQLLQPIPLLRTLAGAIILCLASSAVYLLNDLADLEYDRQHPRKRNRPLASGQLSVAQAQIAVGALLAISLPASFWLGLGFGLIALAYVAINVLYSYYLKHISILDVFIVAAGYVLRVGGGVALINVERFSPWLYVCTTLLALFIVVGKRRAEMVAQNQGDPTQRRAFQGYSVAFLDQLLVILSATTIVAYSLYTFFAENLPANHLMMLSIPFVIYGIFRYLQLVHVENKGGAPDELVLSDASLLLTLLLWGSFSVAVLYFSS